LPWHGNKRNKKRTRARGDKKQARSRGNKKQARRPREQGTDGIKKQKKRPTLNKEGYEEV
jgi:hypothetical protein